ncbi:MAG TPA: PQQ-dependent dehydrogenase, methanol/ethanol family [Candidatus Acidoferrales bacterium]|nr:PQQ-dependent dehydrogenase, methanol/ethanol family [Candidatus Acidoferrales bacterium]
MRNRGRWNSLALLVGLAAWIVSAQQPHLVDDKALLNAGKTGDEWLMNAGNYWQTRYSPLQQIDASNVDRLALAWYYDTGSLPGTLEASPVISNGTLYGTVTWGVVFAVDAGTGKQRWRWDPQVGHQNFPPGSAGNPNKVRTGPSLCCGPGNRGVAVYGDKVYVGTLDARLVALDAGTGKVDWEVQTADKNTDYSITGAPLIVKGKVIIGNGGGEFAVRGYISAYDAETGKLIWRFYTVPGDPSKPFENKAMVAAAKTWSGDWWKLGGGGNPWNSISYDPQLDLLYFGTGQGGPWVQKYRSAPGKDDLYICSIIALKPDTGRFVWYFQTTPGDEWDYDSVADLVLADVKIDGKIRHVLMQAPKNGYFYVLDRKTGKFISGTALQKITWTKGLDPKTGRPINNPDAHYGTAGVTIWPGPGGGHVWQGMSYNPQTGLVYVTPGAASSFNYVQASEFKPELGAYNWGIVFRSSRSTADANGAPPPPPPPPTPSAGGFLVAWDPMRETERWRVPATNGGGTMTTAGNLVFAASSTGEFEAFSADKGQKLWGVKLVQGLANPVSYMLDGKQYVSVLAGRAGNGRLYTFALDGNVPVPPPPLPIPGGSPGTGEAR